MNFFDDKRKIRIEETLKIVTDKNEQIAYLRSSVIGQLIDLCSEVFVVHESDIMNGTFNSTLIKQLPEKQAHAYKLCTKTAVEKIYCSPEVLDVELAGYKIILTLLEHFASAVMHPEKAYSKQLLLRIPDQYETSASTTYGKILSVLDYISGMTDVYALSVIRAKRQ
jgi:dGTPase